MNRKEFSKRCREIYAIGCLACRKKGLPNLYVEVHHLNVGGHAGHKRRGDEFTIGLCCWHHRGVINPTSCEDTPIFDSAMLAMETMGPSLKHTPNMFREEFGSDDELLAEQNRLIERRRKLTVG